MLKHFTPVICREKAGRDRKGERQRERETGRKERRKEGIANPHGAKLGWTHINYEII